MPAARVRLVPFFGSNKNFDGTDGLLAAILHLQLTIKPCMNILYKLQPPSLPDQKTVCDLCEEV
jgi:hypothetical protein